MLEYLTFENIQFILSILGAVLAVIGIIGIKNIRDVQIILSTAQTNFAFIMDFVLKLGKLREMIISANKDGKWSEEELNEIYKFVTTEFDYSLEYVTGVLGNLQDGFILLQKSLNWVMLFLRVKFKM